MRTLTAAMASILAANIKALRTRFGENQTEFAERIGTTQGTVARWEGGAEPKHDAMVKLANLAGCSTEDLTTQLIDGQAAKAPPPIISGGQALLLPVLLPSEAELTAMFEGLLAPLRKETDQRVVAQRLAQTLPNGLAQILGRQSAHRSDIGAIDNALPDGKPQTLASRGS